MTYEEAMALKKLIVNFYGIDEEEVPIETRTGVTIKEE